MIQHVTDVRVSTEKQADRGVSLDAQAEKIRVMALVHNAKLFDSIVGGRVGKNPATSRHRSAARAGGRKIQAIIISKLDRLTRSVKDLCKLLERFERRGVALISVAESLDTSSAAGRLVLNIMTAVSQREREAIGERTRDAMGHKLRQRERVGNIAFGYRLASDGVHVEPDEAEQAALRRIRELRDHHTLRAIAQHLNECGFHTRRGSAWRHEYVKRVLALAS
jgi:site-specific DNA recombinase